MADNNFKILDCTLRDGGYYTKWDFESSIVTDYISSLNKLPIDFIETFGFPKKVLDSHFFFTEYAPKYLSIDFSNKAEILNFILETDGIRKINRLENFLKNISLIISYKYNNQVNNLMLFMSILKNILSSKDRPNINDESVSEIKKIYSNFYMKKIEEILEKKH